MSVVVKITIKPIALLFIYKRWLNKFEYIMWSVDLKNKTGSEFASKNVFIQKQQRITILDKQAIAKAMDNSNKQRRETSFC